MSTTSREMRSNAPGTESLTSGSLLAQNVIWNLIGTGLPFIAGVLCIPPLLHSLGTNRFGVLTLAWMVVGYFSLFDFGLGRALTKLIAARLGAGQTAAIPQIIGTSIVLMTVLGVVGAAFSGALTPYLVDTVLNMPQELRGEARLVFYFLAISIPVVILTTAFRAVLESYQLFFAVNGVRLFSGIFTFLGPVLVLPFTNSLTVVVVVLIIVRVVSAGAYYFICTRRIEAWNEVGVSSIYIRELFGFGGWMTVTNLVGPMMIYFDRFLVGAIVSVAAVAYYATPYEIVTKLFVVPNALCGVLFPAFAIAFVNNRKRLQLLFERAVKYVFLSIFPAVIIFVGSAELGLSVWLGDEFAHHSTVVLQFLAIGVLINSVAQIPFALIQAQGRPDITAKLHLIELPFYFILLWYSIDEFGIEGAAAVWVLRVAADALALFYVASKIAGIPIENIWRSLGLIAGLGAILITCAMVPVNTSLYVTAGMIIGFVLVSWKLLLTHDEKNYGLQFLNKLRNFRR
ncbi:MAG: flippase [Gammaproteobacteria bacterium]|nr:flippase [Gammaproteobacteria bacterium]